MEILMYFLWLIVVTYIILTIDSIRTRTLEETIQRTIDYHSIIIHYRMHRKIQISFSDLSYGVGIFNRKIFSLVDSFKELIYYELIHVLDVYFRILVEFFELTLYKNLSLLYNTIYTQTYQNIRNMSNYFVVWLGKFLKWMQ